MNGHGTLNTGRAVKRARHADRADDTRRVRTVDAAAWQADVIAEAVDASLWADIARDLVDPGGWDRYTRTGR